MQELKFQNNLLLSLINSKTRENQLLTKQNRQLNYQIEGFKSSNTSIINIGDKDSITDLPIESIHSVCIKENEISQQLFKIKELYRKGNAEIEQLKVEISMKEGLIILLKSQLQEKKINEKESKRREQLKLSKRQEELQKLLQGQKKAILQLQELSQRQTDTINQLTQEGLASIQNYQMKIIEQEENIDELSRKVQIYQNKLKQLTIHPQSKATVKIQFSKKQLQIEERISDQRKLIQIDEKQIEKIKSQKNHLDQQIIQKYKQLSQFEHHITESENQHKLIFQQIVRGQQYLGEIRKQINIIESLIEEQAQQRQVQNNQLNLIKKEIQFKNKELIQIQFKSKQKNNLKDKKRSIKIEQTSSMQDEDEFTRLMEVMKTLQDQMRHKEDIIQQLNIQLATSKNNEQTSNSDLWICWKNTNGETIFSFLNSIELTEIAHKHQQLTIQVTELQNQNNQIEEALSNLLLNNKRDQQIKQQNQHLTQQNIRLKQQLNSVKQQNQSKMTQIEARRQYKIIQNSTIGRVHQCSKSGRKLGNEQIQKQQYIQMLNAVIDSIKNQHQQSISKITKKNMLIHQLESRLKQLEYNYTTEITELRNSIAVFGDQYPLNYQMLARQRQLKVTLKNNNQSIQEESFSKMKEHIEDLQNEVQRLSVIVNEQKQQLKKNKNKQKSIQNELNDIMSQGYQIFSQVQDQKQSEADQIDQIKQQKDKLVHLCKNLQEQYQQINIKSHNQAQQIGQLKEELKHLKQIKIMQSSMSQPSPIKMPSQEQSNQNIIYQNKNQEGSNNKQTLAFNFLSGIGSQSRLEGTNDELLDTIAVKQKCITDLKVNLLNIENNYNSQIMNLRIQIAQLNGLVLKLKKQLYQLNPDHDEVSIFVKDHMIESNNYPSNKYHYKMVRPRFQSSFSQFQSQYPNELSQKGSARNKMNRYSLRQYSLGQKIIGRKCIDDNLYHSTLNKNKNKQMNRMLLSQQFNYKQSIVPSFQGQLLRRK